MQLLYNHGKLIAQEKEKDDSCWKLYTLYSFYVMAVWKKNKLKKAEPISNKSWVQFYLDRRNG